MGLKSLLILPILIMLDAETERVQSLVYHPCQMKNSINLGFSIYLLSNASCTAYVCSTLRERGKEKINYWNRYSTDMNESRREFLPTHSAHICSINGCFPEYESWNIAVIKKFRLRIVNSRSTPCTCLDYIFSKFLFVYLDGKRNRRNFTRFRFSFHVIKKEGELATAVLKIAPARSHSCDENRETIFCIDFK